MKRVHDLEVQAFSRQSNSQRYNYFVEKVFEWQEAWGLGDDEGWVIAEMGDIIVFPLWPAEPFAKQCQIDNWQNTEVKKISFDELIQEILPSLANDNVQIAVFMVPENDQCGVLPAQELLNDFIMLNEQQENK
ncbi:DUF2750 domain-containing protein [Entomomonas asaccharolytica]|uniref:DUF2750 domain-containing protein n=1 Tax=Entomomonas asaccharolytica TaxID=2785331 RepID=A0A974NES9_9GAMM|nr:DUF2750 domain-containing protein [Entomomonas asaccharolytica]QQP85274.1 DUF2750 domain-containing protein [Entomomonas asaccharolytica]